jgi:hypothetical protein
LEIQIWKSKEMIQPEGKVIEPDTTAKTLVPNGKQTIGVAKCGAVLQ